MNDHIALFVKAPYLLEYGPAVASIRSGREPVCFNVYGFKDAIQNHVRKVLPRARILRVYWFERESEDTAIENHRVAAMAKNGIKLCSLASLEFDESTSKDVELSESMINRAYELAQNNAISDALFVDDYSLFEESETNQNIVDRMQSMGIHIHFLHLGEVSEHQAMGTRSLLDTFSPIHPEELNHMFLYHGNNLNRERPITVNRSLVASLDNLVSRRQVLSEQLMSPKDEVQFSLLPEPRTRFSRRSTRPSNEIKEFSRGAEPKEFKHRGVRASARAFMNKHFTDASMREDRSDLEDIVSNYVAGMTIEAIGKCLKIWSDGSKDIPVFQDRQVLSACRRQLNRNLSPDERVVMRALFLEAVNARAEEEAIEANDEDPTEASESDFGPIDAYVVKRAFSKTQGSETREQPKELESREISSPLSSASSDVSEEDITEYIELFIGEMNRDDLNTCLSFWAAGNIGVPSDFDKGTMALCRQEMGRPLSEEEKFYMRREFRRIAEEVAVDREA